MRVQADQERAGAGSTVTASSKVSPRMQRRSCKQQANSSTASQVEQSPLQWAHSQAQLCCSCRVNSSLNVFAVPSDAHSCLATTPCKAGSGGLATAGHMLDRHLSGCDDTPDVSRCPCVGSRKPSFWLSNILAACSRPCQPAGILPLKPCNYQPLCLSSIGTFLFWCSSSPLLDSI